MTVFLKPWLIAGPVFGAAWAGIQWMAGLGRIGDFVSLLVLGPIATVVAIGMSRWFDAEMRALSDKAITAVRQRLARRAT
jgi:hypothetical protein